MLRGLELQDRLMPLVLSEFNSATDMEVTYTNDSEILD